MATFADDPKAQKLAVDIAYAQGCANAELAHVDKVTSPRMKVGSAMMHARWQARADRLRNELLDHTGATDPVDGPPTDDPYPPFPDKRP